ncbi:MAG: efflux RND transporter periplasmic adaptor subunit [Planctomycetota bacterium]
MHRIGWVVLVLSICAGCQKEEPALRDPVRPVKMVQFTQERSELEFRYPGRVYANRTVELAFEVPGKLRRLEVVRGQMVRTGALLAELDQRDFRNAKEAAESALKEAKATFDRFKKAAESGAVAQQQVDEARARMQVLESEVRIKSKALEDSTLTASFDGIIADRYVDNFQNVRAKEPVLSFQDISKLEIRVNVPEADMVLGGRGIGELKASFSAIPGREFPLTIKEIATDADPVTQTFLVTGVMPMPKDVEPLPGMTATVLWKPPVPEESTNPTLPTGAVAGLPGESAFVWVIDPETSTVSKRTVQIGPMRGDDRIEIKSGLKPGETVAAAGLHYLEEGAKVRPYNPSEQRRKS